MILNKIKFIFHFNNKYIQPLQAFKKNKKNLTQQQTYLDTQYTKSICYNRYMQK